MPRSQSSRKSSYAVNQGQFPDNDSSKNRETQYFRPPSRVHFDDKFDREYSEPQVFEKEFRVIVELPVTFKIDPRKRNINYFNEMIQKFTSKLNTLAQFENQRNHNSSKFEMFGTVVKSQHELRNYELTKELFNVYCECDALSNLDPINLRFTKESKLPSSSSDKYLNQHTLKNELEVKRGDRKYLKGQQVQQNHDYHRSASNHKYSRDTIYTPHNKNSPVPPKTQTIESFEAPQNLKYQSYSKEHQQRMDTSLKVESTLASNHDNSAINRQSRTNLIDKRNESNFAVGRGKLKHQNQKSEGKILLDDSPKSLKHKYDSKDKSAKKGQVLTTTPVKQSERRSHSPKMQSRTSTLVQANKTPVTHIKKEKCLAIQERQNDLRRRDSKLSSKKSKVNFASHPFADDKEKHQTKKPLQAVNLSGSIKPMESSKISTKEIAKPQKKRYASQSLTALEAKIKKE
eukprot:403331828